MNTSDSVHSFPRTSIGLILSPTRTWPHDRRRGVRFGGDLAIDVHNEKGGGGLSAGRRSGLEVLQTASATGKLVNSEI